MGDATAMPDYRNRFKWAIKDMQPQIGAWSSLCSNIAAEILGEAGFDWVLLDTEHAPNELPAVVTQLQALRGTPASAVVRPAWNDPVLIKRHLDAGAQTLLLPFVQNAEEAKAAVASASYPPRGSRGLSLGSRANGYGRLVSELDQVQKEICIIVQIETREALANLEAIASVEGVDGIFIGPADLSADFGHLGNPGHPEVWAVLETAAGRIRKLGKPPGILVGPNDARRCLDMGFVFVAGCTDIGLITAGSKALLASMK
jgi:4-hydroxy-2-oxoheptanedioate aldolase